MVPRGDILWLDVNEPVATLWDEARDVLDGWQPRAPRHDFQPAWDAAARILGLEDFADLLQLRSPGLRLQLEKKGIDRHHDRARRRQS